MRDANLGGGRFMRNMLALLALLVILFAGVGWYLGWYQVQHKVGDTGNTQVTIDVNARKIGTDLKRGTEKIEQVIDQNSGTATTQQTDKGKTGPN
jgi:hypothetical protein